MILLLITACAGLFDAGRIDETCEDLPGGCDGQGDGGADTGPTIDIAVTALVPDYGPVNGGNSVTIRGGPFTAEAEVRFGGVPAAVRSWTEGELVVDAPTAQGEGWVAVEVTTGEGAGSTDRGYRYFRDQSGKTGLVGFVQYKHSVGALAAQGDVASARLAFLDPVNDDGWWSQYASGPGSCHRDYAPNLGWQPLDPGAATLPLESDHATIALAWDGAEVAYNGVDGTGEVPAAELVPGSSWTIPTFESDELPTFGLPALATVPGAFELTAPAIDTATTPVLTQDDLAFRWSSDGEADAVIIDLTLADAGTGAQVQRVTCLVEDNGSFELPTGAFSLWEPDLVLYLKVGVAVEVIETLPLDQSSTRVVGAYTVSGAATTDE